MPAPCPAIWLTIDEFAVRHAGLEPGAIEVRNAKEALLIAGLTLEQVNRLRLRSLPPDAP